MLLRTSRASEQSACPSTTPALKHTQDKLILQSSVLSAPKPTHQPPTPLSPILSSPSLPSLAASRSHVPSVLVPPLLLCDRSPTLLALVQPSICFRADYKRLHFSNCPHPLLPANIFMWLTDCRVFTPCLAAQSDMWMKSICSKMYFFTLVSCMVGFVNL